MGPRKNVGIVGCGKISDAYLRIAKEFDAFKISACADLKSDRAKVKGQEYGVRVRTVDELITDPEIDIVLNLTIPAAHYEVAEAALLAGKSTYSEKPLCLNREEGRVLVELANEKGLRIGCAPDTFLGAGIQTCRKLIDDGCIGEPVGATAYMMGRGHESWHPDPEFYYKTGGGPMFDMGPYYLTALINLIGPVRRVTGTTTITFPERTITSEPKKGGIVTVDVPTHIAGIMEFLNGTICTITTSFDVWGGMNLPQIEIYGTEGSLSVPNPNTFDGPVHLKERGEDWQEIPLTHNNADNSRGIGVADMSYALSSGRIHRANGDMAFHVLDIMHAFHEASENGTHIEITSTCERPTALPPKLPARTLDP